MKITIKQLLGTLLSSVFVLGLAACSSSPSPWSQSADSPWKSKREADNGGAASEEFVAVPVEEPMPEPEPMPMAEPEPMPMPEPEPMPMTAPTDIMSAPASGYAVQVFAGTTEASIDRYRNAHGLDDLMSVKTDRGGSIIYVLVSVHDDRASADQAAADLQQKTGSKPWVRSVSGLQQIAVP